MQWLVTGGPEAWSLVDRGRKRKAVTRIDCVEAPVCCLGTGTVLDVRCGRWFKFEPCGEPCRGRAASRTGPPPVQRPVQGVRSRAAAPQRRHMTRAPQGARAIRPPLRRGSEYMRVAYR